MARRVLVVTTLLLGVLAAPAGADPRVDAMVAAPRDDPVVVSTALARAVPPADLARLRRAVAAAPVPSRRSNKVRRFVEVLFAPDLGARYANTEARLSARRRAPPEPARPTEEEPEEEAEDGGGGGLLAGGAALALVAAGGTAIARRRRQHAHPAPDDAPVIPARVFEHARTAQAEDLREEIEQRLATAQALADGRPAPPPASLCFFDPRHPGRSRPGRWERGLRVAACPACAADLRAHRPPEALLDDGCPWFEADTLWARTGYGAFAADLPQRVIRGELRRPDG